MNHLAHIFLVTQDFEGQRLDNFLMTYLKGVPRTRIYRIVRKGEVRVNKGRIKPDYRLKESDQIRIPPIRVSEDKTHSVSDGLKNRISQSIMFEDDVMMVINKPSGIAVHGGSGIRSGVIEIIRSIRENAKYLELVHRIDRETSGCLLIAKKRSMLRRLHDLLRENKVKKKYLALVQGRVHENHKKIEAPLCKNQLKSGERVVKIDPVNGKDSVTKIKVVHYYDNCTLVEAMPLTGRTHQIRVHLAHIGHPIVGDEKYGDEKSAKVKFKRLFLHAASIGCVVPEIERKLYFEAPLDADLQNLLQHLESKK